MNNPRNKADIAYLALQAARPQFGVLADLVPVPSLSYFSFSPACLFFSFLHQLFSILKGSR